MAKSPEEIFKSVQEVLIDALGVDEEDVTPGARLVGDLGAESIDFLDISFRLEKAFGIKIGPGDLFPENVLTNPEYVQDGKVTDAGMAELRKKLPHADLGAFDKSRMVDDFSDVFTVDLIVKFVQSKIAA